MAEAPTPVFDTEFFDQIGIDSDVSELIAGDLSPDNPERYQNAGIWAGLIITGATQLAERTGLPGLPREDFNDYLYSTVGTDPTTTRFVHPLFYNEIVQTDSTLHGGRFVSMASWSEPTETIERFVAAVVENDDLKDQADAISANFRNNAGALTSAEIRTMGEQMKPIVVRQRELKADKLDTRAVYPLKDIDFVASIGGEARAKLNFLEQLEPILEEEAIQPDITDVVGAKGANLVRLRRVVDKMQLAEIGIGRYINIPPFMNVGVDAFDAWRSGQPIEDTATEILAWMRQTKGSQYLVRSSAVNSEDGEHMGAGVYASVLLPEEPDRETVLAAMTEVYKSTDSDHAKQYRESIGVTEEKMGLVIQELAGDPDYTKLGTINTMMPQVPQLVDYSIRGGVHPLREELGYDIWRAEKSLALDRPESLAEFGLLQKRTFPHAMRFHVPLDTARHDPIDSWLAIQAGVLAEKIAGRPVQVEFTIENGTINIVQSRPLPEEMLKPVPFGGFPETKEPVFIGGAVGVMDGVKAIANQNFTNLTEQLRESDEPTLFVFDGSYGYGALTDTLAMNIASLSDEDRNRIFVLVDDGIRGTRADKGHVETMFAEIGIPLIFTNGSAGRSAGIRTGDQVEIYSNGYEGRVYKDSDEALDG